MDKNNNGIPDKYEATADYIIASILILFAVLGYIYKDMDLSTVKWLLTLATVLSGGRSALQKFLGR